MYEMVVLSKFTFHTLSFIKIINFTDVIYKHVLFCAYFIVYNYTSGFFVINCFPKHKALYQHFNVHINYLL